MRGNALERKEALVIPDSPLSNPSFEDEPNGDVFEAGALPPAIVSLRLPPPLLALHAPEDPLRAAERLLQTKRKMRILILSSDTGGGHRASAQALCAALEKLYPAEVQVDIVDFWVDLAEGPFSSFPQQYAFLAKHPFLWKMTYELTRFPPGRAVSETFFNTFGHRKIRDAFINYAPDLIVSVHPLVNTLSQKVLRNLQRDTSVPPVPYVTVVTDLGGAHPTWFHRDADMTYVPSNGVREVADRVGIAPDKVRQLGLPVRSDFWTPARDKQELRKDLGMQLNIPAVLVIGGGDGVGGLQKIAETLGNSLGRTLGSDNVQIIVVCGKNERVREFLESKTFSCPLQALGYVNNMSEWMAACDIICTKAGPGTIAEALVRGLPTIVTGFLPGQEAANVRYIVGEGIGEFARNPNKIAKIAAHWLSNPSLLAQMSDKAKACGRPQASIEIARDVMNVAKAKISRNIQEMQRQRQLRDAQVKLARNHLQSYIPNTQLILESSRESHVVFRIKFMLRVIFGSMIVHDALHHTKISTLPTSPVEKTGGEPDIPLVQN